MGKREQRRSQTISGLAEKLGAAVTTQQGAEKEEREWGGSE